MNNKDTFTGTTVEDMLQELIEHTLKESDSKAWDDSIELAEKSLERLQRFKEKGSSIDQRRVLVDLSNTLIRKLDASDQTEYLLEPFTHLVRKYLAETEAGFELVDRPQPATCFKANNDESGFIKAVKTWKRWTAGKGRSTESLEVKEGADEATIRWRQTYDSRELFRYLSIECMSRWQTLRYARIRIWFETIIEIQSAVYLLFDAEVEKKSDEESKAGENEKNGGESDDVEVIQSEEIVDTVISKLQGLKSNLIERKEKHLASVETTGKEAITYWKRIEQIAGTVELPSKLFTSERNDERWDKISVEARERDETLKEVTLALRDKSQVFKELAELELNTDDLHEELSVKIDKRFDDILFRHADELTSYLNETRVTLNQLGDTDASKIQSIIDELNQLFQEKLIEPLSDQELIARFRDEIDLYRTDIQLYANERSEKLLWITDLTLKEENKTPLLKNIEINWRSSLNRILYEQHLRKLEEMPDKLQEIVNSTNDRVKSLMDSAEVNLLAAIDLLESDEVHADEEEGENTFDSIDRILVQLSELLSLKKEELITLKGTYRTQLKEVFDYLHTLIQEKRVGELYQKERELQVRGTALDWKSKLSVYWARIEDRGLVFARYFSLLGKKGYRIIAPWIGLSEDTPQMLGNEKLLGDYLTELDGQFKGLPYIYRNVFDIYNQRDLRYFVGYQSELQITKSILEEWMDGSKRAINVIGEIGSGKSSYLDKLQGFLEEDTPTHRIECIKTLHRESDLIEFLCEKLELEQVETAHDLAEAIKDQPRQIIILEGIQNLFLRIIGGFEALDALYLILSETAGHIMWITAINRYSWEYLDRVMGIGDYYTQIVECDNVGTELLETLIMKRHTSTGYEIRFEPDNEISTYRTYKKVMDNEEERQEYLRREIFERIMAVAKGNISIAMLQWIRSIKEVSKLEMVFKVSSDYGIKLPTRLDNNDFFTLSYFVIHGQSTLEEFAESMHQGREDSRKQLSRLSLQSLLVYEPGEQQFALNPLAYRPVIRILTSKNILH